MRTKRIWDKERAPVKKNKKTAAAKSVLALYATQAGTGSLELFRFITTIIIITGRRRCRAATR